MNRGPHFGFECDYCVPKYFTGDYEEWLQHVTSGFHQMQVGKSRDIRQPWKNEEETYILTGVCLTWDRIPFSRLHLAQMLSGYGLVTELYHNPKYNYIAFTLQGLGTTGMMRAKEVVQIRNFKGMEIVIKPKSDYCTWEWEQLFRIVHDRIDEEQRAEEARAELKTQDAKVQKQGMKVKGSEPRPKPGRSIDSQETVKRFSSVAVAQGSAGVNVAGKEDHIRYHRVSADFNNSQNWRRSDSRPNARASTGPMFGKLEWRTASVTPQPLPNSRTATGVELNKDGDGESVQSQKKRKKKKPKPKSSSASKTDECNQTRTEINDKGNDSIIRKTEKNDSEVVERPKTSDRLPPAGGFFNRPNVPASTQSTVVSTNPVDAYNFRGGFTPGAKGRTKQFPETGTNPSISTPVQPTTQPPKSEYENGSRKPFPNRPSTTSKTFISPGALYEPKRSSYRAPITISAKHTNAFDVKQGKTSETKPPMKLLATTMPQNNEAQPPLRSMMETLPQKPAPSESRELVNRTSLSREQHTSGSEKVPSQKPGSGSRQPLHQRHSQTEHTGGFRRSHKASPSQQRCSQWVETTVKQHQQEGSSNKIVLLSPIFTSQIPASVFNSLVKHPVHVMPRRNVVNPYSSSQAPFPYFFEFFQKLSENTDPVEIKKTKEYVNFNKLDLRSQLEEFLLAQSLTSDEARLRWQLIYDILLLLKQHYPDCEVYPFGSIITGLGDFSSDIDVYVDLTGKGATGKFINQSLESLEQVRKILKNAACPYTNRRFLHHLIPVKSARVPILKLTHGSTRINCDLSFENRLSVQNSKMIQFYMDSDVRIFRFMVLIRYWARFHHLTGSSYIKNYALTLMVLVYLSKKSIVPPIHLLQKLKADERKSNRMTENPDEIDGWDASFCEDLEQIKKVFQPQPFPGCTKGAKSPPPQQKILIEMAIEFFTMFGCEVDFSAVVVCPLLGDFLPKEAFQPGNEKLPASLDRYTNWAIGQPINRRLNTRSPLCIQDPFLLSFNVGCVTPLSIMFKFQIACAKTAEILKNASNLSSLLNVFFPLPSHIGEKKFMRVYKTETKALHLSEEFKTELNREEAKVTSKPSTVAPHPFSPPNPQTSNRYVILPTHLQHLDRLIEKHQLSSLDRKGRWESFLEFDLNQQFESVFVNELAVNQIHKSGADIMGCLTELWQDFVSDFLTEFFEKGLKFKILDTKEATKEVFQDLEATTNSEISNEERRSRWKIKILSKKEEEFLLAAAVQMHSNKTPVKVESLNKKIQSVCSTKAKENTQMKYKMTKVQVHYPFWEKRAVFVDKAAQDMPSMEDIFVPIVPKEKKKEKKKKRGDAKSSNANTGSPPCLHSFNPIVFEGQVADLMILEHQRKTEDLEEDGKGKIFSGFVVNIYSKLDLSSNEHRPRLSLQFEKDNTTTTDQGQAFFRAMQALSNILDDALPSYVTFRLLKWLDVESAPLPLPISISKATLSSDSNIEEQEANNEEKVKKKKRRAKTELEEVLLLPSSSSDYSELEKEEDELFILRVEPEDAKTMDIGTNNPEEEKGDGDETTEVEKALLASASQNALPLKDAKIEQEYSTIQLETLPVCSDVITEKSLDVAEEVHISNNNTDSIAIDIERGNNDTCIEQETCVEEVLPLDSRTSAVEVEDGITVLSSSTEKENDKPINDTYTEDSKNDVVLDDKIGEKDEKELEMSKMLKTKPEPICLNETTGSDQLETESGKDELSNQEAGDRDKKDAIDVESKFTETSAKEDNEVSCLEMPPLSNSSTLDAKEKADVAQNEQVLHDDGLLQTEPLACNEKVTNDLAAERKDKYNEGEESVDSCSMALETQTELPTNIFAAEPEDIDETTKIVSDSPSVEGPEKNGETEAKIDNSVGTDLNINQEKDKVSSDNVEEATQLLPTVMLQMKDPETALGETEIKSSVLHCPPEVEPLTSADGIEVDSKSELIQGHAEPEMSPTSFNDLPIDQNLIAVSSDVVNPTENKESVGAKLELELSKASCNEGISGTEIVFADITTANEAECFDSLDKKEDPISVKVPDVTPSPPTSPSNTLEEEKQHVEISGPGLDCPTGSEEVVITSGNDSNVVAVESSSEHSTIVKKRTESGSSEKVIRVGSKNETEEESPLTPPKSGIEQRSVETIEPELTRPISPPAAVAATADGDGTE